MAASRKLQGEIERCLKKVTEGVETFEDIWQKVHNAANTNQKEKYEADLKKEIKKLQRLRDQIKSWIASAEIKDKSNLLDYRKLIETQMERFKVVERETKTKAYSKEGLGAAQKLDPAQKEKEEISAWLVQAIDALNLQVDQFESEIESLIAGGKKKRVDKDKQDRVDDLKSKVEKHRFHIKKLETILRMLDNMSVEVNQVKKIKDDIEYYIESSQDADFQENEYLYDDIEGIDDFDLTGIGITGSVNTDSNGTPTSLTSSPAHTSPLLHQQNSVEFPPTTLTSEEKKKEKVPLSSSVPPSSLANISTNMLVKPTPVRASSITSSGSSSTNNNNNNNNNNISVSATSSNASTKSSMLQMQSICSAPISLNSSIMNTSVITKSSISNDPQSHLHHYSVSQTNATPTQSSGNFATVAASNVYHSTSSTSCNTKIIPGNFSNENGFPLYSVSNISTNIASTSSNNNLQSSMVSCDESHNNIQLSSSPCLSIHGGPSPISTNSTTHSEHSSLTSLKNTSQNQDSIENVILDASQMDGSCNNREVTTEVHIPPILGVAPLGPVPLTSEQQLNFRMMEAAFTHMPHSADSERLRSYLPKNPCTIPSYYPQIPLTNADSLEYHTKLATDTLFFIFYYSEGTKSQYLAAKALKKQSWRFHTKYMMWFQRHEEPRTINEEYEQGTYIYFDYEKWTQRKKEGFTFEYKYLEDRELS